MKILYQGGDTVHIWNIALFVKRVLRLRHKLAATMLCIFIFLYKKQIMAGEEVIVELDRIVRYYHWLDLCYDLLLAEKKTKYSAIYELTNQELLETIRYKVYRLNYTKLNPSLIKIIIKNMGSYNDVKLSDTFSH